MKEHAIGVIPNLISASRIVLTLFIIFRIPTNVKLILPLFILALLTDWLDGWTARLLKSETLLGAKLDPIADKILYFGILWILIPKISIIFWIFIVTMPSEIMLTTIRFWPLNKWLNVYIPATDIGKIKMVFQSGAIVCMLFGLAINYWPLTMEGIFIAFLAIPFSWASLWSHFQNHQQPQT